MAETSLLSTQAESKLESELSPDFRSELSSEVISELSAELAGDDLSLAEEKPTGLENLGQKFFIKTFGCQMNVADTERMSSLLSEKGMTEAATAEQADVLIINGCSVREKAVHKAVSSLGKLAEFKEGLAGGRKPPVIGLGGCVGQLEQGKLFKRAPYLDFVFGTDTIDNLPEIVHRVQNGEKHVVFADFDKSMDYSTETKVFSQKAQAFVNIMKGCDKYCTYCIVPFTRGREKSRLIDEVVFDIARLVASGVREVTLLGQNVNSFGKGNANTKLREPAELHNVIGKVGPRAGEENFPQLLRAIDNDPRCAELKLIRFTSSHPLDFSDELIECYAPADQGGVGRLAMNLHLPVQSGSNRVLQKMGRHHQIENYFAQMDRLRELSPDVGISSDIIVGFPTETEEDFQDTLRLLDRVQFDGVYAFAYSPRPGTRAAKLADDVPDTVKNERLNRLLDYQQKIAETRYASRIGKEMTILVEGESKNKKIMAGLASDIPRGGHAHAVDGSHIEVTAVEGAPTQNRVWNGRTSCNRVVNFVSGSSRTLVGKFVTVKIVAASGLTLQGELL